MLTLRVQCGAHALPFQFNVQRLPKVINDDIFVKQVSCDECDDLEQEELRHKCECFH